MQREIKISKNLTYLCRHGAVKAGLPIGRDGYIPLNDILTRNNFTGITLADIQQIVQTNDKQRFSLQERPDGWYIKANQGHSIEVPELDLTRITRENVKDYPVVVHGTYHSPMKAIRRDGLSVMSRQHIHFAIGEPEKEGVISGMRSSAEVMIYIDLEKAVNDGVPFYISENKVILTPGIDGYLHPKYFKAVLEAVTREPV